MDVFRTDRIRNVVLLKNLFNLNKILEIYQFF